MRITVHNAHRYGSSEWVFIELHVSHLWGDHYEQYTGKPGSWRSGITGTGKRPRSSRRRVLDREYRRMSKLWPRDSR